MYSNISQNVRWRKKKRPKQLPSMIQNWTESLCGCTLLLLPPKGSCRSLFFSKSP